MESVGLRVPAQCLLGKCPGRMFLSPFLISVWVLLSAWSPQRGRDLVSAVVFTW